MKSSIIFPKTAWLNAGFGFSGTDNLNKALVDKAITFDVEREYQAIIFEFDDLDTSTLELIRGILPDDYEIPALLNGHCSILSKDRMIACDPTDEHFQRLMRDAHLEITAGEEPGLDQSKLSMNEINEMCDIFGDIEGIPMPLKEFHIERLLENLSIQKAFEPKLTRILVDIKTIWFALDYDLLQLSRNTDSPLSKGLKIYGLPDLRGTEEEQAITKRFKRYIYINSSIVRIRALWEKLIGLAVLLERPDHFDIILGARRVRSKFIKEFRNAKNPVTRYIWDYVHSIELFEARFRSPELHKIGRTIWWASQEKLGEETNRLLGYRNDLNRTLREILALIGATHNSSA